MTLVASCHCGSTTIELSQLPTRRLECNCTYCTKSGAIWGYPLEDEMVVREDRHQGTYAPNVLNVHHYCTQCGMQTWGVSPDWSEIANNDGTFKPGFDANTMPTRKSYAVNLKLLDEFDMATLTAEKIDGRNSW